MNRTVTLSAASDALTWLTLRAGPKDDASADAVLRFMEELAGDDIRLWEMVDALALVALVRMEWLSEHGLPPLPQQLANFGLFIETERLRHAAR